MKKSFTLLQFFPLAVFLLVARSHNFTGNAWYYAFQLGAIAALIETGILLFLVGHQLNRLMCGINLYLVVGGLSILFNISIMLNFLDSLREAGVIFFIGLVCVLATLFTRTGVFETTFSNKNLEKNFSLFFLVAIAVTFVWSYFHRGDTLMGGFIPILILVILKSMFQRQMLKQNSK